MGTRRACRLFGLGTIACLGLAAAAARAEPGVPLKEGVPHVTTTGTARVEIKPDLATISLGVQIERPTADDALAETARRAKMLVDDLSAQTIAERDIRTVDFRLVALYDEARDDKGRVTARTLRGYQAQDIFALRVRDVDQAGAIARRALDHGANMFGGIDFQLEHASDRRIELGGEAVKRARLQAETYARALGVTLDRVLEIDTSGGGAADLPMRRMLAAAPAQAGDAPIPLAPGVVVVDASVNVTFELKAP